MIGYDEGLEADGATEAQSVAFRGSGKLERAKSGSIPQAFGRGCYGYTYNPATGQREIETFQAEVVRRIFTHYAEASGFNLVSYDLNRDGIPAFSGGRWFSA